MENKRLLCCALEAWARIVAWFHIVLYGLTTILLVIVTVIVLVNFNDYYEDSDGGTVAGVWIIMGVSIVIALAGVLLGVFLLRGIQQRNIGKLRSWMIIEGVLTGLSILGVIFGVTWQDPSILAEVAGVILNILSIWIVHMYRKEVIEQLLQTQLHVNNGFVVFQQPQVEYINYGMNNPYYNNGAP